LNGKLKQKKWEDIGTETSEGTSDWGKLTVYFYKQRGWKDEVHVNFLFDMILTT
jgi:hypothetical protein